MISDHFKSPSMKDLLKFTKVSTMHIAVYFTAENKMIVERMTKKSNISKDMLLSLARVF